MPKAKPGLRASRLSISSDQKTPGVEEMMESRVSLSALLSELSGELDRLFSTFNDTCAALDPVSWSLVHEQDQGEIGEAPAAPLPDALNAVCRSIQRVRSMRASMADLNGRILL